MNYFLTYVKAYVAPILASCIYMDLYASRESFFYEKLVVYSIISIFFTSWDIIL